MDVLSYAMLCYVAPPLVLPQPPSRYVMLCYVMLYYAMLCYVMLCDMMLCYAMICYAMLCYVMLRCSTPCFTIAPSCYIMLCYVMLCYVMLCYVMLCYVMLCYAKKFVYLKLSFEERNKIVYLKLAFQELQIENSKFPDEIVFIKS